MIEFWESLYKEKSLTITDFAPEKESSEYSACDVKFEGNISKFRIAKITPKKIGQFVTIWKRENNGPIQPFDNSDNFKFIIIAVQNSNNLGHFIFPKEILAKRGIITDKKEGKRAIRVYPPWDIAENSQAKTTQKWQLEYFTKLQ